MDLNNLEQRRPKTRTNERLSNWGWPSDPMSLGLGKNSNLRLNRFDNDSADLTVEDRIIRDTPLFKLAG